MNHQRWIKPLPNTLFLCCAAALLITLRLSVADDEPAAPLRKQRAAEHLAQTTEPFTIAVLPDTQFYCDTRLKLSAKWGNGDLRRYFFAQTEWVRDNQERLNIAFLVHEGDIVQADAPEEWAIAKEAMSVLDGKVPYCMCLGNHDMGFEKADNKYGGNIGVNRTTHFNTYFPREKFANRHEFGGTCDPDRHDNSWYHFEAAGMSFLIVALECKPRDEVLAWANQVVSEHPDHRVIVLTHAYMNAGKSRNTGGMSAKGNTGEQTWQKFVKDGILHRDGEPYRGVGANYFDLFYRVLRDGSNTSYDEGLRKLSAADIPFVRFMAGGFWPVDWDLYFQDKEEYFKRMDAVVRSAEKHNIGLVPSLFWNMATFPDLVGEPMDQLGNERAYMLKLVADLNQRMKSTERTYKAEKAGAHQPSTAPESKAE